MRIRERAAKTALSMLEVAGAARDAEASAAADVIDHVFTDHLAG